MRSELNLSEMADVMSAIVHYREMFSHFTQLDQGQRDKLQEFWKRKFPDKKAFDQFTYGKWASPNIHIVEQSWSNTSGGWETIGGAAITSSYTTIIENVWHGFIAVYYNGRLAYIAEIDDELQSYKSKGYQFLPGIRGAKSKLTLVYYRTK